MAGFAAADAAAGLLVAGMIGMTGCDILVESIQQLSDSANLDLQEELREVLEEWVDTDPDVLQITTLRARQVGSASFCDVTVETWPDLTTTATRAVEERLKKYLVPTLQERTGHWISATVNAKAPLEMKDARMNNGKSLSSSFIANGGDKDTSVTTPSTATSTTPSNPDSSYASSKNEDDVEMMIKEDLSASQVEMRVRQRALQLDAASSYRLQSVQVHYLSSDSVSVDITLDHSKMDLNELKAKARSLQLALENDLGEIQSARIYLDLIGREREHGMSDEVQGTATLSAGTSSSSTSNTAVRVEEQSASMLMMDCDQGDLSLLEVDPEWPASFAYDMQRIWEESTTNTQFTTNTTTTGKI